MKTTSLEAKVEGQHTLLKTIVDSIAPTTNHGTQKDSLRGLLNATGRSSHRKIDAAEPAAPQLKGFHHAATGMNDELAMADDLAVVRQGPELAVRIQNSSGHVENVLREIDAEGIEVLAHGFYCVQGDTNLLVVSEFPDVARAVIETAGYNCETRPVIWVEAPHRIGLATGLEEQLRASGVDILYTYSSEEDGQQAIVVFRTTQDDLALPILSNALKGLALTPYLLTDLVQQSGPVSDKR